MATISHVAEGSYESFDGLEFSTLGEPFDETLRSLTRLLGTCAMGVALFDRTLRCRAFNGALGKAVGVSVKKHIGKQLRHLFPGGVPQLERALRRVWVTGSCLSNLELAAPSLTGEEPRRWLVNFFPISSESGEVRLIAATFSEITKERCVESKIDRLKDKFESVVQRQPELLDGEFSETSARTFEVVNRSLALLKSSVLLRFSASQRRLEAGLGQHALYLKGGSEQDAISAFGPPDREVEETNDLGACSPSPREREVLQFLADGKSNKEIGLILDISTRTVEAYRARIMTKLDLHSTAALVRYAIRNKIVEA